MRRMRGTTFPEGDARPEGTPADGPPRRANSRAPGARTIGSGRLFGCAQSAPRRNTRSSFTRPARSTVPIPAASRSRSRTAASSRSTGRSPTRSPSGYICAKVRRFAERTDGEARLLHPAVRVGPKGNAALRERDLGRGARPHREAPRETRDTAGGEAILPFSYGGSNGLLTQDTTDARLFRRLGASRLARNVCAAPTGAANGALYGKMPCIELRRLRPRAS